MEDPDRLRRDTATIVRIIKFLLILSLVLAGLYLGLRLLLLLLPFVIGFILAETSIALANALHRLSTRRANGIRASGGRRSGAGRKRSRGRQPGGTQTRESVDKGEPGVPVEPGVHGEPGAAGVLVEPGVPGEPVGMRRPLIGKWPDSTRPAIVIYFLFVILFFVLVIGVIFIAFSQLRSLATYLTFFFTRNHVADQLVASLHNFLLQASGGLMTEATIQAVQAQIDTILRDLVQRIPSMVTSIVNGLGSFVADLPVIFFSLIVVIMSGYYFISDSKSVTTFMKRNLPHTAFREKTGRLIATLANKLFRIMGGYLFLFLYTFTISLFGLILIRLPYALVFALVAAFVDFLPVLGIGATMGPIAIYMFLNGNILGAIGAIAIGSFIALSRRIIEPPVLGGAMQLHPLATLFAMIVGVGIYGLLGLLIGPVILVIGNEVLTLYGFDIKLRNLVSELLGKFGD